MRILHIERLSQISGNIVADSINDVAVAVCLLDLYHLVQFTVQITWSEGQND